MKAVLLESPSAVKALLDSGADPNAVNEEGTTALMWASTRGLEWVNPLLDRGANPKASDRQGFTALMVAAGYSGMRPVMSRLIAAGADVNALTTNGWSALRDAVKSGDTATVQLLLEHGAVLLASARNSNRMMMISVTQDDTAMLALLLGRGLPVDQGPAGYTGLMAAASDGQEGPLQLLLSRGANPNAVEARDGLTPLMYAALQDPGHDRVVRTLLKAGAKVDMTSTEGLTALDYAKKYGHTHLAAALMAATR
jgi:ankyrin repeat protein